MRLGEYIKGTNIDCEGKLCNEDGVQNIDVLKATAHPEYKPAPDWMNDICLLELKLPAKITSINETYILIEGILCINTIKPLLNLSIQSIKFNIIFFFIEFVSPVCLPYEDNYNETYKNENLSLSGWGFTTVKKAEKNTGIMSTV